MTAIISHETICLFINVSFAKEVEHLLANHRVICILHDRLRISNPLTQDLATVSMLMTALNLSKDQATSAILEALNEGDEDEETDVSRFQQVQDMYVQINKNHQVQKSMISL